jgi:hypothetical protein
LAIPESQPNSDTILQLAVGAVDAFGVDLFEQLAEIVAFEFKTFLFEANGKLNAGNGVVARKHRPNARFEILFFLVGDAGHGKEG